MTKSFGSAELQRLIYERLSAAGISVSDYVEENTEFPFVSIGETATEDAGIKGESGNRFTEEIDIWSRADGFKEIKSIADRIAEALEGPYPDDEWQIEYLGFSVFECERLGDGITRHGAIKAEFFMFEK